MFVTRDRGHRACLRWCNSRRLLKDGLNSRQDRSLQEALNQRFKLMTMPPSKSLTTNFNLRTVEQRNRRRIRRWLNIWSQSDAKRSKRTCSRAPIRKEGEFSHYFTSFFTFTLFSNKYSALELHPKCVQNLICLGHNIWQVGKSSAKFTSRSGLEI